MAAPLVSDELWSIIEPHLPVKPRRKRNPGRKPVPNRACLAGILFVLKSGIPWEMLPQEMGCGCGMTCWRRLDQWKQAGVWQKVHEILLSQLRAADAIDFERALVDSGTVRALGGRSDRPQPRRPRKTRVQTPRADRRRRCADRGQDHRGQPSRRDGAVEPGQRRAGDQG